MNKMLDVLLWSVVALAIVIFFAIIIIGDATSYDFLSMIADDQTVLSTNIQYLTHNLF